MQDAALQYQNNPEQLEQQRYKRAKRRVKAQRGFYIHLMVYVLVNAFLMATYIFQSRTAWWSFGTLFGWGIGLVAHGATVFLFPHFLGKDWEERKIRELMGKDAV
jgi:hypothetical protein